MQKWLVKIGHGLILATMGAGLFAASLFYEQNIPKYVAQAQHGGVSLQTGGKSVEVQRAGASLRVGGGAQLEQGDVLVVGEVVDGLVMKFAADGELRLDKGAKVRIVALDDQKQIFVFEILAGRVWLQNVYSNASVNLRLPGAVILPGQSVVAVDVVDGRADVSVWENNAVLGLLSAAGEKVTGLLSEGGSDIINRLYLPEGTQVSVSGSKIASNREAVSKLLYSKLVKEFNYSVIDRSKLRDDVWLSENIRKDGEMLERVRQERLAKIRTRGVKYAALDSSNYKWDQTWRDFSNALTFSEKKVGQRNLDALYDLLYDAQYLFDYGRADEAKERLSSFTGMANQLFVIYGDDLKRVYTDRVKYEYEYLSFALPSDSLFQLRQVLEKIYLEAIRGQQSELSMKFAFLTEKLAVMNYYAERNDYKNIKNTFDEYMVAFKDLMARVQPGQLEHLLQLQRQNQTLDNLFAQYSAFYRQNYFTDKLFVENKYLSMLPLGKDKPEEMQSVIAQRIDFLRRLKNFFLRGEVPLIDAQNIMALLFSEIARIELPSDYQVAVSELFHQRLEDYGLFGRFLNSPEYVTSTSRGSTPEQRFEQFKEDNKQNVSIDELRREFGGGEVYEVGRSVNVPTQSVMGQEGGAVDTMVDGVLLDVPPKTKAPRVKRTN